jgi:hypothetical protein
MKEITNPYPELLERAKVVSHFLATAIGHCSLLFPPGVTHLKVFVHYNDGVVMEILTEPVSSTPGPTPVTSLKRDKSTN